LGGIRRIHHHIVVEDLPPFRVLLPEYEVISGQLHGRDGAVFIGGKGLDPASALHYVVPEVLKIEDFDFQVPGVTSISADLHKYGYAAKGASVILYRGRDLRLHQFFVHTDWTGGIYASPAMAGSRPGGAIAAAWAVLNFLGEEGYLEIVKKVMQATDHLKAGVAELEGIPAKYLEQVLSTLRKSGILVSEKGKEGGYVLRIPPEEMTESRWYRPIRVPTSGSSDTGSESAGFGKEESSESTASMASTF